MRASLPQVNSSFPAALLWLLKCLGRQSLDQEPPDDYKDKNYKGVIHSNASDHHEYAKESAPERSVSRPIHLEHTCPDGKPHNSMV